MSRFSHWAQTEHSPRARIIALIPAGAVFVVFLPYLFLVICPALDQRLLAEVPKPGVATLIVGSVLVAVGMFFALWSIQVQFTRGRGTPLPMLPTQGLLRTGPFRYCRNPMTLGTVLAYLGMSIAAATAIGLTLVLILAGLLILYLKRVEEKELAERFGEDYLVYLREVPFIIPKRPRRN
jgi:protein-S-isoprenylcysteine O-methyltransferase Ste14